MGGRLVLVAVILLQMAAIIVAADATYRAPRTSLGQPDLEGVWNFNSGVPLERPAAVGTRATFTPEEFEARRGTIRNGVSAVQSLAPIESAGLVFLGNPLYVDDRRTALITYPANGHLPEVVAGAKRSPRPADVIALLGDSKGPPPGIAALLAAFGGGKKETYKDFGLSERCILGPDVPLLPGIEDNVVQITQGTDYVAVRNDFHTRLIPLTSTAVPPARTWAGASRGHWDGDTLVVETRNFNGRNDSFAGIGTSRDKAVTERFTRVSPTTLHYSAVVVDPSTFKDRVEIAFPMARVDAQIYEAACHEGNYSLTNALKLIAQ